MSLRIIYGRAGCGKTRCCLEEIKSRIENNVKHPLVLLVPEQFTLQAEKDLIEVLGTGGILKTEVLSFRRMAFRIFNQAGGITYPHIHPAGKSMIIYRIMDKMKNDLKMFTKTANRQGFVNTLSEMIGEFKQYKITPDILKEAVNNFDEEDPLKEKLIELNSIYEQFEQTISKRYRDSDDYLTIAAQKLLSISLYDRAEVWIDGFAGFTPQEYTMIERLLKKADVVNITLCTDCLEERGLDGGDVFSTVKGAYNKLLNITRENKIKIETHVALNREPLYRFKDSCELSHLERNFNAYPYKVYREKTKNISLFSSVNIFSEIEAAAEDIKRLCMDEGMRYRNIAVVVRNLKDYERHIQVVFDEYEIPYFIDRKIDITNHPLVRLIISMLNIFNDNWSYEAVFRYLKTGLTGIDKTSIDILENYVLACRIRGSSWTSDREWDMSPDIFSRGKDTEEQREILNEINRIRLLISQPLMEFRKRIKGRKETSEICGALYDFLCDTGVPERIEKSIDEFRRTGNMNLANEYGQVWNIVMEVFDQAVEIMRDETISLERFTHMLEIGFGEYKVGLIPASLDQVLVGSLERSRSHEVKALFIMGTNDGVIPSFLAEDVIFSDLDREALNSAGIELASDTRARAFDEQYLIYRALTTAGRCLRLSWPIGDHEGRTMRPSIIISRIRKIFPEITETSNLLKPDALKPQNENVLLPVGKNSAFKQMVSAMRERACGKDISPVWREVYNWFASQEEWKDKCQTVSLELNYKNTAQQVSKGRITALYGNPVYSSVSRLEKYNSCPFAYFIQYGLRAKERKIFGFRAPDIGTFIHTAIEKVSRYICEENISWQEIDRQWCTEKVSEIVEELLDKIKDSGIAGSKRYTILTVRLKRVISRAVWIIAEHIRCSSFEPIGYEMDFGNKGQFPPVPIRLDSGEKILLSGRIDRVDALKKEEGTYLRIVDYKTGNKDFSLSDVFYGLQVQLLAYLDAIWESSGMGIKPPVIPGGVLYFRVDDPLIKNMSRITVEEIEQEILKKLRMKGLLLSDINLIKDMDNTIDGSSLIIPARINKGDVLGKSSAATLEEFEVLRKYVRMLLKGMCEEMMQGNVSIRPYKKKGATSCDYCEFSAVCQFDLNRRENTYKLLYDREDKEVWDLIKKLLAKNSHDGKKDGDR